MAAAHRLQHVQVVLPQQLCSMCRLNLRYRTAVGISIMQSMKHGQGYTYDFSAMHVQEQAAHHQTLQQPFINTAEPA